MKQQTQSVKVTEDDFIKCECGYDLYAPLFKVFKVKHPFLVNEFVTGTKEAGLFCTKCGKAINVLQLKKEEPKNDKTLSIV